MATIEDLSTETLVQIFSHYIQSEGHLKFLRNIPGVCKYWYQASSTPSLWRHVTVYHPKCLVRFSERGLLCHTQSLEINYFHEYFFDINYSEVFKNIQNLKALSLWDETLHNDLIMMQVTEHCQHLECLRLEIPRTDMMPHFLTMPRFMEIFLTARGPTLKRLHLIFSCSHEVEQQLLSLIANKCSLLEALFLGDIVVLIPISELGSGCPMLRELEFSRCNNVSFGSNDLFLGCGFKNLKKFSASYSDFGNLDLQVLFKDSTELEHLKLHYNYRLEYSNILKIPSDKIRILDIMLGEHGRHLEPIGEAVKKWRYTLSVLKIQYMQCAFSKCDNSCVLEKLIHDNEKPQLQSLVINDNIDPYFFEKFLQKCQNLIHLQIDEKHYEGWEEIKEALEFLMKRG